MCRQWRNRRQHILNEPVIQGARPTQQYMAWFRSVTTQQFVSEPRYLMDPRQHASSSYAPQQFTTQHQCEPTQTQQPTIQHQPTTYTQQPNTQHRNPFMPTTQQPTIQRRNPFIPPTQTQNQESNPATTTVYSPDDSYGSLHRSPPPMNTQPLFNYSTPQEPLLRFQNDSMAQFGQLYRPQFTQPQRPNYDDMGTELHYGSAVGQSPSGYWEQMMTHLSNTAGTSVGPSNQPSLDQVSTQRPQTPQENRGRPRR